MKAFLVGLIVVVMAFLLSGVGLLLLPLFLLLGIFLRVLVGFLVFMLVIWGIGTLTLLVIDLIKGPRPGNS